MKAGMAIKGQGRPVRFLYDELPRLEVWKKTERQLGEALNSVASAKRLTAPSVFGLQLRATYDLTLKDERDKLYRATKTENSSQPSLRRFFLRPSPEPILLSFVSSFRAENESLSKASDLASSLYGAKLTVRNGSIGSSGFFGAPTSYMHPDSISAAWEVRANRSEDRGPYARAFQRFLDFTQIHPFHDGNGRCARALLAYDLAKIFGDHSIAMLPLGPFTYLSSTQLLAGYGRIDSHGDDEAFFACMSKILMDCCDYILSGDLN